MPRIADEQFMEQRRSGTPVSKNEDWRLGDRRPGDRLTKQCRLSETKGRVKNAHETRGRSDIPFRPVDRESMPSEELGPGKGIAPEPKMRRPFLFFGSAVGGIGGGHAEVSFSAELEPANGWPMTANRWLAQIALALFRYDGYYTNASQCLKAAQVSVGQRLITWRGVEQW